MEDDIIYMKIALENLNRLPIISQNSEYSNITNLVFEYLKKNCCHKIIEDTIDIGPEKTKQIFYCEKCYLPF